ncbi:tetraspanin-2 isoform X2 [Amborella trichopoda]|uniref:tetraspanin-2 isoform X2 n=1 Tax=Amborella trichopoda TaxID=13333 RepID=UPI0009BF21A6|nr:tetraspanin-2 isoform X2 [Amborella trichopoda]|eukprot:XP_020523648.1 tetraspanin-2 isoform X2 [Amborella trichopoda]
MRFGCKFFELLQSCRGLHRKKRKMKRGRFYLCPIFPCGEICVKKYKKRHVLYFKKSPCYQKLFPNDRERGTAAKSKLCNNGSKNDSSPLTSSHSYTFLLPHSTDTSSYTYPSLSFSLSLSLAMDDVKVVIAKLKICATLFSFPILGVGIWMLCMTDADCEYLLRMPKLKIILGVMLIIIFVFRSDGAESRGVSGSPRWLQMRVRNTENWQNVKSCIFTLDMCGDLAQRTMHMTSYDFNMMKLTPIESGCCKPPLSCGMIGVNATYWEPEPTGEQELSNMEDSDCATWSNQRNILCYNCNSCKAGFLQSLQKRWQKIGIILITMVVLELLLHTLIFVAVRWKPHPKS